MKFNWKCATCGKETHGYQKRKFCSKNCYYRDLSSRAVTGGGQVDKTMTDQFRTYMGLGFKISMHKETSELFVCMATLDGRKFGGAAMNIEQAWDFCQQEISRYLADGTEPSGVSNFPIETA